MKKLIIVFVAVILIGMSIITVHKYNASSVNSNSDKTGSQSTSTNVGTSKTKAIDFKLKDLNGTQLSLSDLKGKKIFLNFWATWCPPCKSEMPEIEKLYEETKNSDLVIVTIETGDSLSTVKSLIDSNNYTFKVLLDSNQSVSADYNIASIPTSYFIDVNGNTVSKHIGAMNINQMKEYIKALGQ